MKKLFIPSVFILIIIFDSNLIAQELESLEMINYIPFPEVFMDMNDQQVDKFIKESLQNGFIIYSSQTNHSLFHTNIYLYQPDKSGYIQPMKIVLRI